MRLLKARDWDREDPIVYPEEDNEAEEKVAAMVQYCLSANGLLCLTGSLASSAGREVLETAQPEDFSPAFRRQLMGRVLDEFRGRLKMAQDEVDGVGMAKFARWFDKPEDVARVCSSTIDKIVAARDRWEQEAQCVTDDPRIIKDRVSAMSSAVNTIDQTEWFASVRMGFEV